MTGPQIRDLFGGRVDYATRSPWITEREREKDRKFNRPVKEFLINELADIGDEDILDVGSGVFPETYLPDDKIDQTTKTDFIDIPTESREHFVKIDANNLSSSFGESTFGAVIMKQVYTHLENPDGAIDQVNKVLKKGGKFILIDWEEGEEVEEERNISNSVPEMVTGFNSEKMMKKIEDFGFESLKRKVLVEKTTTAVNYKVHLSAIVARKK